MQKQDKQKLYTKYLLLVIFVIVVSFAAYFLLVMCQGFDPDSLENSKILFIMKNLYIMVDILLFTSIIRDYIRLTH